MKYEFVLKYFFEEKIQEKSDEQLYSRFYLFDGVSSIERYVNILNKLQATRETKCHTSV